VGIETRTIDRSFHEFVTSNPELRIELIFVAVFALVMQVSLLCRYIRHPADVLLWIHLLVQASLVFAYSTYLYYYYEQWVSDNKRVLVIK